MPPRTGVRGLSDNTNCISAAGRGTLCAGQRRNTHVRTFTYGHSWPVVAAVIGILASSADTAAAQESDREGASILFGTFITDRDTSARLDSGLSDGSDIDLEDDLGLEGSSTVARLGGYWWINDRHRLDVSYFDLSRDASKRIQETIEFGDEIFAIDTVVTVTSDLTVVKTDYTFALLARDRGYLGITGGLYVSQTTLGISAANVSAREEQDVTAPLPVVGLRGDYAITDHITLRGVVQIFDYSADNVDGSLTDFYFGADYSFGDHWAVGLAWNEVTMTLSAEDDNGRNGSLDWGYDGALLYVKFDFGNGR